MSSMRWGLTLPRLTGRIRLLGPHTEKRSDFRQTAFPEVLDGCDLVAARSVGIHRSGVRVVGGGHAIVTKGLPTCFTAGGEKEASDG